MFNARQSSATPPLRSTPDTQTHSSVQPPTQRTTSLSQGPYGPGSVNPNRSVRAKLAQSIADDDAFGRQLDEWVAAGGQNERRKDAAALIRTCKKDNSQVLNLKCLKLRSLPTCVESLSNLATLDFHSNCLETLPNGFGKLTGLRCLTLNNNKLKTLPDGFVKLIELRTLAIHKNPL